MASKRTLRALVSSVLSLVLCCSMLIGTTFAWFTDSVTSANNIITAGNLDIELYYQNDETSGWTPVDARTNVFKQGTLWEPGHTEVVKLMVANEGTLALKYQLGVNVESETTSFNVAGALLKLSDHIEFAIIDGEQNYTRAQAVAAAEGKSTALKQAYDSDIIVLYPKAEAAIDNTKASEAVVTMVVYMPTTVGNEANYGKGMPVPQINLGLNLLANQYTFEEDSFDENYDANAGITFVEVPPEDAQAAIWNAPDNSVIHLTGGNYGALVIENADGTPKKNITITSETPNNYTSAPFSVYSIDLKGSKNVTISNIWFDMHFAQQVGNYYASITDSVGGAKNIVIYNCKFDTQKAYWAESTVNPNNYIPVCFAEDVEDITVQQCYLPGKDIFSFVRFDGKTAGTVRILDNSMTRPYKAIDSVVVLTNNAADLVIHDNNFYNWNSEKGMLTTNRQGSDLITVEITDNTIQNRLTGDGVVLDFGSGYTAENCEITFQGNSFGGGLYGKTEATVPCNMPS